MSAPLIPGFRFQSEPWDGDSDRAAHGAPLREAEVHSFARRLELSTGGTHLVTGYRGVGKTTFVNAALRAMRASLGRATNPTELIDIHLAIARSMSGAELMHHMLRGIHEKLRTREVLPRLPREVSEDLELAFLRTSAALTLKSSSASELSAGASDGKPPWLGFLGASFSLGARRTRRRDREIEYLGYDDKAAEADIIGISRRLRDGVALRRWARFPFFARRTPIRLLIVLDELDKIDSEFAGGAESSALDEILHNLKTLLTASGITFVFVAGRDLHDRWIADLGHGDSVYESIFCDATYIPVAWDQVPALCDPLVQLDSLDESDRAAFEHFKGFLGYKGRGIPRRILRGFNESVTWHGDAPTLDMGPHRSFKFYSRLRDHLRAAEDEVFGESAADLRPEVRDKQRLGLLYTCDWILQQGGASFDFETVVGAAAELSSRIAPDARIAPRLIGDLIRVLERGDYLERDGTATVRVADEPADRFRVPRRRLIEMGRLSDFFEDEDAGAGRERLPDLGARYQASSLLGSGGTCNVYEAIDVRKGSSVAVKIGRPEVASLAAATIRNEAAVLQRIEGPNVVRLLDAQLDRDDPFLVLEIIDGILMSQMVPEEATVHYQKVAGLGAQILSAVARVHERGYVWRDPKPSNIFVTFDGRVVLFDFGVSVEEGAPDPLGGTHRGVGTLPYIAPELLRGEPATAAADVYGICVIFYKELDGSVPFLGDDPETLLRAIQDGAPPLPQLPEAFADLRDLILRGLAEDSAARPTIRELLAPWQDGGLEGELDVGEYAKRSDVVHDRIDSSTQVFKTVRPEPQPPTAAPTMPPPAAAAPESLPGDMGGAEATPQIASEADSEHTIVFAKNRPADKPRFEIRTREGSVTYYSLAGQKECTIGRNDSNDLTIVDGRVSRYHAVAERAAEGFSIRELNSQNGIKVNGEAIGDRPTLLRDGDVLEMGAATLLYEA